MQSPEAIGVVKAVGPCAITGAASGIGRQLALDLLATGAELILIDKDLAGLRSVAEVHPGRCSIVEHDFSSGGFPEGKLARAINERGRIAGLVHVAGISCLAPMKSLDRADLERVMSVNAFSAFDLVKQCVKNKSHSPSGLSVVFVSSIYSLVGSPANSVYAMSKAALNGFARALAIEFAPKQIRFNCVAPGFIRTEMLETLAQRMGGNYLEDLEKLHPLGLGRAEDVPNAIQFLLSDKARWITGSVLTVDGGFTAQ